MKVGETMKWFLVAVISLVGFATVAEAGTKFEFNFGTSRYGYGYYRPPMVRPGYGYYDRWGNYHIVTPRYYYGPPTRYDYYGPSMNLRIGPDRR